MSNDVTNCGSSVLFATNTILKIIKQKKVKGFLVKTYLRIYLRQGAGRPKDSMIRSNLKSGSLSPTKTKYSFLSLFS